MRLTDILMTVSFSHCHVPALSSGFLLRWRGMIQGVPA